MEINLKETVKIYIKLNDEELLDLTLGKRIELDIDDSMRIDISYQPLRNPDDKEPYLNRETCDV